MTTKQNEFIQQHLQGAALTPEQAAQLLELGGEGDTGTTPDDGGAPDASPAESANAPAVVPAVEKGAQAPAEGTPDPANAVILARDGKHTIDYQKLVDAREAEKHWRGEAEAAQQELAALKAQADQRAQAGHAPTQTDNQVVAAQAAIDQGVDPEIFGDFSEEALTKGIATLVERRVAGVLAQVDAKLQPLQQKQTVDAREAHFQAIYQVHADADSLVESQELESWIASQPSFARAGYESVLQQGSTTEVIELFNAFKAARTTQAAAPMAAKPAMARPVMPVPASLTDIPGGYAGATSPEEAMAAMSGQDLLDAMSDKNWSSEQIEAYLNRRM